ncbi:MAG: threonine synthase [bacterium]|nr:threonine synthase [bacterium]
MTNSTSINLRCSECGKQYSLSEIVNLCQCGKPLLVEYDYALAMKSLTVESLKGRDQNMWKYREMLPVQNRKHVISLGEGGTELLAAQRTGVKLGLKNLLLKDESTNPTGSFKARGLSMAVSRAHELGLNKLIVPTAGNAGSALSAYGARASMEICVVMPSASDPVFITDCQAHGARVELIDGSIKDCGEYAAGLVASEDYFSVATLKEPYRIEGKKTMGYELAEQLGWTLPDVIIYPTGGGTGLIGMWKAFDELEQLGLIDSKRPRMVSVQSEGCAPIVKAFDEGKKEAELWPHPETAALGLRVPSAVGDFLILNAVRESNGTAISVSEQEIYKSTLDLASQEGIFAAPEAGATLAALKKLLASGFVAATDQVVLFLTGSGYKYLEFFRK